MFHKKLGILVTCVSCLIVLMGLTGCTNSSPINTNTTISTSTFTVSNNTTIRPFTIPAITNTPISTSIIPIITNTLTSTSSAPISTGLPSIGPGGYSLDAITTGPDGNLWFTDGAAGKIGKISPTTGIITEYPVTVSP